MKVRQKSTEKAGMTEGERLVSSKWGCEVCHAKPGQECSNTINAGQPLPGRAEHLARAQPPGRSKAKGAE